MIKRQRKKCKRIEYFFLIAFIFTVLSYFTFLLPYMENRYNKKIHELRTVLQSQTSISEVRKYMQAKGLSYECDDKIGECLISQPIYLISTTVKNINIYYTKEGKIKDSHVFILD